jgi:hypothetical protein
LRQVWKQAAMSRSRKDSIGGRAAPPGA